MMIANRIQKIKGKFFVFDKCVKEILGQYDTLLEAQNKLNSELPQ